MTNDELQALLDAAGDAPYEAVSQRPDRGVGYVIRNARGAVIGEMADADIAATVIGAAGHPDRLMARARLFAAAPDLARDLIATRAALAEAQAEAARLTGERDRFRKERDADRIGRDVWLQIAKSEQARAEAAEAALATARAEGRREGLKEIVERGLGREPIEAAFKALPADADGTIAEGEMERVIIAAIRALIGGGNGR